MGFEAITGPNAIAQGGASASASALIPSGTVMLFYQASAPTGWTQVVSQNDKALRVVSGSGGVSGGTNPFSTVMAQTVVGNFTLTTNEIPSHTHTFATTNSAAGGSTLNLVPGANSNAGTIGTFTTNATGNGAAHNHSITMSIQYIDIIIASKN